MMLQVAKDIAEIVFWSAMAVYVLYGIAWGLAAAFARGGGL